MELSHLSMSHISIHGPQVKFHSRKRPPTSVTTYLFASFAGTKHHHT
jgi:hypothetical protein